MRKKTKIAIGVGVVVVIAAVSALTAATRGDKATQVRIEEVARRDLVATVSASGWIEPHRKVEVQADLMGRITELPVVEGQRVERGQILIRLDPTQYEAAVARGRAAVSEAQSREAQASANLAQAQRAYERTKALASQSQSLVSQQVLEEAETQVRVQTQLLEGARFSVAQARSAVAEAVDRLSKTTIRAPMDGVITRLNVEEGETAIVGTMNNSGSLLLTIADLSTMEAVVRVDETDVPDLHVGDSATVEIDAFPRQKFTGKVTEIGQSAITAPSTAGVGQGGQGQAIDFEERIQLDNPPPSLRSDLSATAEIVTAVRRNALAVPIIALTVREAEEDEEIPQEEAGASAAAARAAGDSRANPDREGVFLVREGKSVFVPVEIGIAGREHFEIVSGVAEGDSVVAGPYEAIRTLESDKPVRPLQQTPARGRTTTTSN